MVNSSRIFFLHNPKAGGSSLRRLFLTLFSSEAAAPVFSNAPNDHRENKASFACHRDYHFYAGHYGYDVFEQLRDEHALVTNFRDPVERIISLYRYWRNNVSASSLEGLDKRDAAVVQLSHSLSFSEFIRSPNQDLKLYISNFHFRQLFSSPWEPMTARPWDIWRVKRRISSMPWFYVAEMPAASIALLRTAFPALAATQMPNENNSVGDAVQLTLADARHLVALNRLDYAIYRHSVYEQTRRLMVPSN